MNAQLSGAFSVAAQLGILGLDPIKFLHTKDEDERELMVELAKRMWDIMEAVQHNLAVEIANQVGKMFKG